MTDRPAPPRRFSLVTFDLDGTLTAVHGWKVIAEATGRSAEFKATNRRFFAGEISEDVHLKNLLDLALGLRLDEVGAILERTPRVHGISETLDGVRARGMRSALLTHNPTYVCDWYLARFPFDDAEGTPGTVVTDGRIVDSGPAIAGKLAGLHSLAARFDLPLSSIVHVGDGAADAAVFEQVGAGIAFNTRLADVERRADAAVRSKSLTAILPVLDGLAGAPRGER
jgi:HAD superfamily phosphoserine phosphatase-like hydrolase